jgi:hypothetical protein
VPYLHEVGIINHFGANHTAAGRHCGAYGSMVQCAYAVILHGNKKSA